MSRFHFYISGHSRLSELEFFGGPPGQVNDERILEELEGITPVELLVDWGLDRDMKVNLLDTVTGAVYEEERGQWVRR